MDFQRPHGCLGHLPLGVPSRCGPAQVEYGYCRPSRLELVSHPTSCARVHFIGQNSTRPRPLGNAFDTPLVVSTRVGALLSQLAARWSHLTHGPPRTPVSLCDEVQESPDAGHRVTRSSKLLDSVRRDIGNRIAFAIVLTGTPQRDHATNSRRQFAAPTVTTGLKWHPRAINGSKANTQRL